MECGCKAGKNRVLTSVALPLVGFGYDLGKNLRFLQKVKFDYFDMLVINKHSNKKCFKVESLEPIARFREAMR